LRQKNSAQFAESFLLAVDDLNTLYRQQGVALIIVLLIFALISILATEMIMRMQFQVKRTAAFKESNQAYWYAMSAEQYARQSISQILDLDDGRVHLGQPWNKEFTFPIEGGGIQAELKDLQTCFNLNALGNADQQASDNAAQAFKTLLNNAKVDIPSFNVDTVTDSLIDWMDADDAPRSFGAESSEYESKTFPYIAANALLADKSEMRLIHGVEMEWLNEIMPLLCVLPANDGLKININTVDQETAAVLAGVTGLTSGQANNIINNRPEDGYQSIDEFLSDPEVAALNLDGGRQAWLDITTEHFILYTKTRYNNATFNMSSVFRVQDSKVSVIRREFGGKP
jgi:general secretion pathway protein K